MTLEPCAAPRPDRTVRRRRSSRRASARVVVALEDPDPRVAGRGIERLRAAGVAVDVGVGADRRRPRPRARTCTTGAPAGAFAVLKTATSIDGRTAAADGTSQWITGAAARADGHGLRADAQAVVVGAGTALADQPDAHRPRLRSRARAPAACASCSTPAAASPPTGPLFDTGTRADARRHHRRRAAGAVADAWRAAGAKVEVVAPGPAGGVDLDEMLALLGREGVLERAVRGRRDACTASLLRAGLVDRIVSYVGGVVLGPDGLAAFAGPGPATLADAPTLASGRRRPRSTATPDSRGSRPDVHRHRRGARARSAPSSRSEGGVRLEIEATTVLDDAALGASIAVNGCCLTVVELGAGLVGGRRGRRDARPHHARHARAPATP